MDTQHETQEQGPYVTTVPKAGRQYLDLGRSASYRAAKNGEIPVIWVGGMMKVPIALMRRMVGLEA